MTATWFRLRAQLRTGWRPVVGLGILIAIFGGIALAAAAGARRTATAYPRFVVASHDGDVLISPLATGFHGLYAEIRQLPEVADLRPLAGMAMPLLGPSGGPDPNVSYHYVDVDPRRPSTARPNLLEGRLPKPDRTLEALANRLLASYLHLAVGDHLTLQVVPDEAAFGAAAARLADAVPVTFTIVGIGVTTTDVVPLAHDDSNRGLWLTPAFFRSYADPDHLAFDGAIVRLRPGADMGAFRHEVDLVAARHPEAGEVYFAAQAGRRADVERALRPDSIALALFALLMGATVLLVGGQLLARSVLLDAADHRTLVAVGMSPGQLVALEMARVGIVAVGGGVGAVGLAVAASPLFPIGPARLAEPHRGFAVNAALLLGGFVVLVAGLAARAAAPARTSARATTRAAVPARRPRTWAAPALPMTAKTGMWMALDTGRGPSAVPVRSTVAGTALALVALTTAYTFGANLDHLVTTPRLYGQTWDAAVDLQFLPATADDAGPLVADHAIGALAAGSYGIVSVGGKEVPAVGIDAVKGAIFPTLLDGRPPRAPDEVVLGSTVLHRLHRSVGDEVHVEIGGEDHLMRVVGRAVFPRLGRGGFPTTALGLGAATTAGALAQPDVTYNFWLVRWAGQPALPTVEEWEGAKFPACPTTACVVTRQRPGDIDSYSRVRRTPLVLSGVLILLAGATLAHTLVTSIRRRRRELAILKTLGFVRRQVAASVVWHATALAGLALVVGLPLGIAAGRWAWDAFAKQLGVQAAPSTPIGPVALAGPAIVAFANAVALLPARRAARTPPALVLRAD